MEQRFIVAEVSKNWETESSERDLLCSRFEMVINVNHDRGYILKDWKISSVVNNGYINETIIAIFEKQIPD